MLLRHLLGAAEKAAAGVDPFIQGAAYEALAYNFTQSHTFDANCDAAVIVVGCKEIDISSWTADTMRIDGVDMTQVAYGRYAAGDTDGVRIYHLNNPSTGTVDIVQANGEVGREYTVVVLEFDRTLTLEHNSTNNNTGQSGSPWTKTTTITPVSGEVVVGTILAGNSSRTRWINNCYGENSSGSSANLTQDYEFVETSDDLYYYTMGVTCEYATGDVTNYQVVAETNLSVTSYYNYHAVAVFS